jgi:hypothetical protein
VLYLQADNCGRENKNHALFCYLGWLVERAVFKEIHLSYFHVGHTHFGPDQVASRISCCARCADIYTRLDNARILRDSYTPKLDFEHLDDVVNCQDLFFGPKIVNPDTGKSYRSYARSHGSAVKKLNLISTIRHIKFSMGVDDSAVGGAPKTRVVYMVKPSAGAVWSQPAFLFWHSPSGLSLEGWESPSGVPNVKRKWGESLVKTPAETKPMVLEAEKGLKAARGRITDDSYKSCMRDIEKLRNPKQRKFHWEDGGKFKKEQEQRPSAEVEGVLELEEAESENQCVSTYKSRSAWATASLEGTKGVAKGSMVMFTSYTTKRNPTAQRWEVAEQGAPVSDKRPYWYMGKVQAVRTEESCLEVHFFSSTPLRSLAQTSRPYTAGDKIILVEIEDVFLTFPGLDKNGRMPRDVRKKVGKWLRGSETSDTIQAVADTSYDVLEEDGFEAAPVQKRKSVRKSVVASAPLAEVVVVSGEKKQKRRRARRNTGI